MSKITSSSNQISIAYYVKAVNDRFGKYPDISAALSETGVDLAETIQSALMTTLKLLMNLLDPLHLSVWIEMQE